MSQRSSHRPKSAVAFIDGQNLHHGAREAFGYDYPNFDVRALSEAVCRTQGWQLRETRFYTGVPAESDNPFWSQFWAAKLGVMGHQGIVTFTRPLRYRWQFIRLSDGTERSIRSGEEKGIDVRLALDVIRYAYLGSDDVLLIFSQDQDLSEVGDDVRKLAAEQGRFIQVASAYPVGPTSRNRRGINGTKWIPIDRVTYDQCLDPRDYRLKRSLAA